MIPLQAIENLKKKSPYLAQIFLSSWEQPLSEYCKRLYSAKKAPIEIELIDSFREEWIAMGFRQEKSDRAIKQLCDLPVLQTSQHVTPTNGPGFLSLDLISISGLPKNNLYLVGASSGVAFSNSAWTGAFSYGSTDLSSILQDGTASYNRAQKSAKERKKHGDEDQRISLIPAKQRDQLVFGTEITDPHTKIVDDLTAPFKDLISTFSVGNLYSHWAVKSCNLIQNQIFNTDRILYFDINQVLKRYLLKVLKNEDHPVYELIFKRIDIWKKFDYPPLFLMNYRGKKSNKVDPLIWDTKELISRKTGCDSKSKEEIIQALQENRYCPAIFLMFFILRFLNGIKCLGSFNQIEYLERFRRDWLKIKVDWKLDLEEDWRESLTTGRLLVGQTPQWSLDYFLKGETLEISDFASQPMGIFWEPILNQLTNKA